MSSLVTFSSPNHLINYNVYLSLLHVVHSEYPRIIIIIIIIILLLLVSAIEQVEDAIKMAIAEIDDATFSGLTCTPGG